MEDIPAQMQQILRENQGGDLMAMEIDGGAEDGNDDNVMDGGVAYMGGVGGEGGRARTIDDCDLMLFVTCEEALDIAPEHPILKPGVSVRIGLEKSTKLSCLFQRYIDFCNESAEGTDKITTSDVEFVHCQLLVGSETAEANALMKNDRIIVRKDKKFEREAELEKKRLQRDADRTYFQQIRHLMADYGGAKSADIILDCQGKIVDEHGRNQQVLSSTVKAHSAFIKRRCPWLYGMVQTARIEAAEQKRKEEAEEPNDEAIIHPESNDNTHFVQNIDQDAKSADQADDDMAVLSLAPNEEKQGEKPESSAVAEIEDDEEEQSPFDPSVPKKISYPTRSGFPAIVPPEKQSAPDNSLLRVVVENHSPEAIKLLLEYCYSNRVACLGHEAFVQACKTRPMKHSGPVAPFTISSSGSRNRWPRNGHPTISFQVALAGIVLAEEAGMPRLSLMCEIAASNLLSSSNIVDALSLCNSQKGATGNDLPRLRKAAMERILGHGTRGVTELGRSQSFRRALRERRADIIPSLLHGTMELVTTHEKSRGFKRDRKDNLDIFFQDLDSDDKYRRDKERKKRKLEQIHSDPNKQHEIIQFEMFYDECRASSTRSLQRMAKHLESMPSRAISVLNSRNRYSFPGSSHRRSSNSRRRSSGSNHHP